LRADLASPTWKLTPRGIVIESKDEIRARLGRSPGKGDAVVMALSEGQKAAVRALRIQDYASGELGHRGRRPQVVLGHEARRAIARR
jgi:hypothetical protein